MSKKNNPEMVRITNNKLSYKIIDRIMQPSLKVNDPNHEGQLITVTNLTAHELDLLIYLSTIQDSYGNVSGVHYMDIKLAINCCKSTCYNALKGLDFKGYIKIKYTSCDQYWDLTILDNVFINSEDDKKGYLNTNKQFLHSSKFKKLKVNEKKLCIKLFISCIASKGTFKVYPKQIASWLGIKSTSLVFSYMENICSIFKHTRKKGLKGELFILLPGNSAIQKNNKNSERENFLSHKIKYFCSQFKVNYTIKDLKDLVILLGQYASLGTKLYSTICNVLLSKHTIEPALINSILSKS